MALRAENYEIENAEIGFRNFAGAEGPCNAAGERSFAVFLRPEDEKVLTEKGWNVKHTKAKDDDGNAKGYLPVSVAYKNYPPKIVLITSRAKTVLDEEVVEMLDWADIRNVDLVLRPYNWTVNGNTGIKAYIKSMYVVLEEDAFEAKYADIPEGR